MNILHVASIVTNNWVQDATTCKDNLGWPKLKTCRTHHKLHEYSPWCFKKFSMVLLLFWPSAFFSPTLTIVSPTKSPIPFTAYFLNSTLQELIWAFKNLASTWNLLLVSIVSTVSPSIFKPFVNWLWKIKFHNHSTRGVKEECSLSRTRWPYVSCNVAAYLCSCWQNVLRLLSWRHVRLPMRRRIDSNYRQVYYYRSLNTSTCSSHTSTPQHSPASASAAMEIGKSLTCFLSPLTTYPYNIITGVVVIGTSLYFFILRR